jgi:hypothetical protein
VAKTCFAARTGDRPREPSISVGYSSSGAGNRSLPRFFSWPRLAILKKRPVAASNNDPRQPLETAISRKPISIKDVAFRTSFGLGPEKTEYHGPNRERKAGGPGESMVQRGALERYETGEGSRYSPVIADNERKPAPGEVFRKGGFVFIIWNGGGGN